MMYQETSSMYAQPYSNPLSKKEPWFRGLFDWALVFAKSGRGSFFSLGNAHAAGQLLRRSQLYELAGRNLVKNIDTNYHDQTYNTHLEIEEPAVTPNTPGGGNPPTEG